MEVNLDSFKIGFNPRESESMRKTLENEKLRKTGEVAKGEKPPSHRCIVREIQQATSENFMTSPKSRE